MTTADNISYVARVFVGLGSNLGDREASLRQALDRLAAEPKLDVLRVSSFRETDPVDFLDQPRFVNAVAEVSTDLPPRQLLDTLLAIEQGLGRRREASPRYGPRTIDLDLLLYDDEVLEEPGLTVPHPRLHERRFALEPLAELDPGLVVPGRGPLSALLAGLE